MLSYDHDFIRKRIYNQIIDYAKSEDLLKISIISHSTPMPDGDSICSSIALQEILKGMVEYFGIKNYEIGCFYKTNKNEYAKKVLTYIKESYNKDFAEPIFEANESMLENTNILIVLDTDIERTNFDLKEIKKIMQKKDTIAALIDHHERRDSVFPSICKETFEVVDSKASSTCECIINIFYKRFILETCTYGYNINVQFDKILEEMRRKIKILNILYGGVYTDTGAFKYTKFNRAIEAVNFAAIECNHIYYQNRDCITTNEREIEFCEKLDSDEILKIPQNSLGLLMNESTDPADKIIKANWYNKLNFYNPENGYEIAENALEDHTNIVSVLVVNEKVDMINSKGRLTSLKPIHICQNFDTIAQLAIIIKDNYCKVELRSSIEKINVKEFAATYGGGGHIQAAGCNIEITGLKVMETINAFIGDFLTHVKNELKK